VNEQKLLFQSDQEVWVERLWLRVPAASRRQILAILAEMARSALVDHTSTNAKEADDER